MQRSMALYNLHKRQIEAIKKTVSSLHEDLQYDYEIQFNEMNL